MEADFFYRAKPQEMLHADLTWNVAAAMASVSVLNTTYFSSLPSPFANPSKTNNSNQQLEGHGNAKDDHQPQQKKAAVKLTDRQRRRPVCQECRLHKANLSPLFLFHNTL